MAVYREGYDVLKKIQTASIQVINDAWYCGAPDD